MTTNRDTYNRIAESWYRLKHWPRFTKELEAMSLRWQSGKLLNIGCAHGPDFLPFKDNFELYGIDFSAEMIQLARKYSTKFKYSVNLITADASSLPFADNSFDFAIAVASYHHIKPSGQHQAFTNLHRILKPGGEVFLTVWNRWQRRFWKSSKELYVPWKTREGIHDRYYYLFSYRELQKKLTTAKLSIVNAFPEYSYNMPLKYFSQNICVIARKED